MVWLVLVTKIVWINFETATLYKWIYYIPDGESYESHAWYETFDQCEEDALCNVNTYCQDKDVIHLYIYR